MRPLFLFLGFLFLFLYSPFSFSNIKVIFTPEKIQIQKEKEPLKILSLENKTFPRMIFAILKNGQQYYVSSIDSLEKKSLDLEGQETDHWLLRSYYPATPDIELNRTQGEYEISQPL